MRKEIDLNELSDSQKDIVREILLRKLFVLEIFNKSVYESEFFLSDGEEVIYKICTYDAEKIIKYDGFRSTIKTDENGTKITRYNNNRKNEIMLLMRL